MKILITRISARLQMALFATLTPVARRCYPCAARLQEVNYLGMLMVIPSHPSNPRLFASGLDREFHSGDERSLRLSVAGRD